MKEKQIQINTINIQVNEVTIKLTMEDAKKLHEVLGELFKKEFVWSAPTVIERVVEKYPYWYNKPYYTDDTFKITCETGLYGSNLDANKLT